MTDPAVTSRGLPAPMDEPQPTFSGTTVTVGDHSWPVPYPVRDARRVDRRVFVLYDHTAGPTGEAFRNLEAFDDSGRKLWTAESPVGNASDAYVEFASLAPLVVGNFAGFQCMIDPADGRILGAGFTK